MTTTTTRTMGLSPFVPWAVHFTRPAAPAGSARPSIGRMEFGAGSPADRFAACRVARLATVRESGEPHLVPIVFAVTGAVIHTAVDAKPKRTRHLRRLANIAANPRVSVLADHYDE